MTLKEQIILNHYKTIIEKRAFDEYDILGFLIFIRAWVTNDGVIREFCDLIAHRERNQGRVMRCIEGAIKNDYESARYPMRITLTGRDWIRILPGVSACTPRKCC